MVSKKNNKIDFENFDEKVVLCFFNIRLVNLLIIICFDLYEANLYTYKYLSTILIPYQNIFFNQ